jgi:hypothetical protein
MKSSVMNGALLLLLIMGVSAQAELLGEYGYISALGPQPEDKIRTIVATMARDYGVREFMFYDWFADYSTPVRGTEWKDPFFRRRPISRATIVAAIDEIHRHHGRAWAYVQAVGAEEDNLESASTDIWKLRGKNGEWYWHPPGEQPRFPTYFPNSAWARFMVDRWAPAVKELGFDGIHWDTLGPIAGDRGAEIQGLHAFVETASMALRRQRLRQTMNYVELNGWDRELVRKYCEFPYAEVWSDDKKRQYYAQMDMPDMRRVRGVMAMYPSTQKPQGWQETDIIIARHNEARKHRLVYVILGDGERRMKNEYWPETVPLTDAERMFLRQHGKNVVTDAKGTRKQGKSKMSAVRDE